MAATRSALDVKCVTRQATLCGLGHTRVIASDTLPLHSSAAFSGSASCPSTSCASQRPSQAPPSPQTHCSRGLGWLLGVLSSELLGVLSSGSWVCSRVAPGCALEWLLGALSSELVGVLSSKPLGVLSSGS